MQPIQPTAQLSATGLINGPPRSIQYLSGMTIGITDILIPLNYKTFKILNTVYIILGLSLTLYVLVLLLFVPYLIVKNISIGKAFDLKTIKLVDFLAYNFLFYPFIYFILQLLMKGVLRKYITPDVSFTGMTDFLNNGWIIYIGLFLFALGVALKRGYNLQQEQDLTV